VRTKGVFTIKVAFLRFQRMGAELYNLKIVKRKRKTKKEKRIRGEVESEEHFMTL